jgi:hypothetical protein
MNGGGYAARVQYEAVEATIRRMVNTVDEQRLLAFGSETVLRLTRDNELLGCVSRWELDASAWQALGGACQDVLRAGPVELRRRLAQIDAGVLSDGDMDSILLLVLASLDLWASFLETGGRREVADLVMRLLDLVDFQAEDGDLADFLASPDVAAEYARITHALVHAPQTPTDHAS